MSINQRFGKWMRMNRESRGWSQLDMEVELESSAKYISDVELGKRNISLNFAKRVCDVFGVSLIEMFDEIQ